MNFVKRFKGGPAARLRNMAEGAEARSANLSDYPIDRYLGNYHNTSKYIYISTI